MAVSLTTTIQRFQGLSTDIKPEAPPEGSTYHAVDTGIEYVFFAGMWEQDLRLITAMQAV
jgi:hypothetical protein